MLLSGISHPPFLVNLQCSIRHWLTRYGISTCNCIIFSQIVSFIQLVQNRYCNHFQYYVADIGNFKCDQWQLSLSCKANDFLGTTFITAYTSSPFLFTDYPLYFFCLQFTAQTVIFDNVARDRYLTKDFDNGLGSEVRPNWRSRSTDSSFKLYLDISTIYHALMWHNSSAFLLPVMTFQKEFRLVTLIFKLIQISNRSGVEGSVLMTLKGKIICIIICWNV